MAESSLARPVKVAGQSTQSHSALNRRGDRDGAVHFRSLMSSTLANVAGMGLVALILHEFFHLVTLQALGGSGYITFGWDLGLTHFTDLPDHLWAVRLSGGVLTGAFLLLFFWRREYTSHSGRNISREMAAFAWASGHLAYAPIEMLGYSPTAEVVAFGIGFGAAAGLYLMKLIKTLPLPQRELTASTSDSRSAR